MPTLTVRDIPKSLYEHLRERATRHRRSMSSEVVMILESAVGPRPIDVEELIREAEEVHALFREPLPDRTAEAKRGRRYENDLSDDREAAGG